MAAQNKVEKFGLGERILALSAEGRTTQEIADVLTSELTGKTSISQPTVARWLKSVRQERSEQTRSIVHDHIKSQVPQDLEALEEVEAWLLTQFRDKDAEVKDRADFGMRAIRIIETKLRFAGILEDPTAGAGAAHPVDLAQFRNEVEDLKEAAADG